MSEATHSKDSPATSGGMSQFLTGLMAASCGLIVANLYYAQPLAGLIGDTLRLPPSQDGLIVTFTQIGYCLGLLLIVPLADLLENRRLIVTMTGGVAVALVAAGTATSGSVFLITMGLVGLASVAVQILVPFAAHLAPEASRGRVVGNVMSGLMLGIMMARPVASLIAQFLSWKSVFLISAVLMAGLAVILARCLPSRRPGVQQGYGQLLFSMLHLLLDARPLQRRAFYQACMFGAFSLFWTVTPLMLMGPRFQFSQAEIALFAIVGLAGAVAAPLAGRFADRGNIQAASLMAMLLSAGAFAATWVVPESWFLPVLTLGGVLVDVGTSANLVLGQRVLFVLAPEQRARLNGLYMAIFFVGGAIGSALGGWAYQASGWQLASALGCVLPLLAFLVCLTERKAK